MQQQLWTYEVDITETRYGINLHRRLLSNNNNFIRVLYRVLVNYTKELEKKFKSKEWFSLLKNWLLRRCYNCYYQIDATCYQPLSRYNFWREGITIDCYCRHFKPNYRGRKGVILTYHYNRNSEYEEIIEEEEL